MSRRSIPNFIANFDSATGMLRALARFLRGHDFPNLGLYPSPFEPVFKLYGALVNALPRSLQEEVYIQGGRAEAIPPGQLGSIRAEEVARWMVAEYPRRPYPAALIGSSNGALVHLGAALGIPWLPQTFLIPVRHNGLHPDEPKQDLEWARAPARALLAANPDLALHHMHDANQDRLMIQRMTYFRVKWLRLVAAYRRFLIETLEPGATLFLVECTLKWPTVRIAERHVFQHGALGGATAEEYQQGSRRVAEYLARYGSHRRHWDAPAPDGHSPEAEWGFEPALRDDVTEFAREHGYRVRRIVFEQPEDLSPLVADLYRFWYRRRRLPANRLMVGSFILMEPWWALRTGSVPFWMVFNTEPSADALGHYLDSVAPYDEIFLMLFSHGVDSVGLVPIDRWRTLLHRARRRGEFLGVDERVYPRDFATFVHYHADVPRQITARYPLPGPLTLGQLDAFLDEAGDRYLVRWLDHQTAGRWSRSRR
ncbi:MAG: hypothetical protein IRY99_02415 [Isosphaeraceae bacterium]|nr:hypothetical protein [Isosphaeraceae bacterium]